MQLPEMIRDLPQQSFKIVMFKIMQFSECLLFVHGQKLYTRKYCAPDAVFQ